MLGQVLKTKTSATILAFPNGLGFLSSLRGFSVDSPLVLYLLHDIILSSLAYPYSGFFLAHAVLGRPCASIFPALVLELLLLYDRFGLEDLTAFHESLFGFATTVLL